jgi:hypothetical protein
MQARAGAVVAAVLMIAFGAVRGGGGLGSGGSARTQVDGTWVGGTA